MGELLTFETHYQKRLVDKWMSTIGRWYQNAASTAEDFGQLLAQDPRVAIDQLPRYLDQAANADGGGYHPGGPNHDWTAPIIDLIGIVYPHLDNNVRAEALKRSLGFLDGLNYFNAQFNVELLNEPWLVADIIVNRPLYWCGFKSYSELLRQKRAWAELQPDLEGARSAFWMAYTVVRTEYTTPEVQANFYRIFPTLVDRTQDAAAALIACDAQRENLQDGIPVEESIEAALFKYDKTLHTSIRSKIGERKWIILEDNPYYRTETYQDHSK